MVFTFIDTPMGRLRAAEDKGKLIALDRMTEPFPGAEEEKSGLLLRLEAELHEYFSGKRRTFDIPIHVEDTPFRMKCYEGLMSIPYGETRSYKWLAEYAGSPKGARAAGGACHKNPILILVPCHRVMGSDGSFTGFGPGIDKKAMLLALESEEKCPEK